MVVLIKSNAPHKSIGTTLKSGFTGSLGLPEVWGYLKSGVT